jgi:hypothetical protein
MRLDELKGLAGAIAGEPFVIQRGVKDNCFGKPTQSEGTDLTEKATPFFFSSIC